MSRAVIPRSRSRQAAAGFLVLACVVIGVAGLVLPVIPGLLFLAIAAYIAARQFPSFDARLRSHRAIARHMGNADRFGRLSLGAKVQVAGWLCLKAIAEGFASLKSLVAKLGSGLR
jgi:uncharacterized membrane protein YbaN (DUF454 family)